MADEDLEQTIIDAANGPAKVTVDGQTVEQPALGDLIEADKHLANKQAAKKAGVGGIKFMKIVPPGDGVMRWSLRKRYNAMYHRML